MVRALTSHQCGPGLNSDVDAICGLSLLFVLVTALRVFSLDSPIFLPHKNQHFKIPIRPERIGTFEFEFLSGGLFGAQQVNNGNYYVYVFFILTITIIMVTIITYSRTSSILSEVHRILSCFPKLTYDCTVFFFSVFGYCYMYQV